MTQPISSGLHVTVYPAKGQTAEAQGADELQCYNWAKNQTGIDPQTQQAKVDSQTTQAPQQAQTKGTRAKGAVGGAAAGALIGEIASDDAGKGAAIGATTGVLAGGARARREERADQEAQTKAKEEQEKAQAAQAESLNTFKKAFGTCLQGRGYTTAH